MPVLKDGSGYTSCGYPWCDSDPVAGHYYCEPHLNQRGEFDQNSGDSAE